MPINLLVVCIKFSYNLKLHIIVGDTIFFTVKLIKRPKFEMVERCNHPLHDIINYYHSLNLIVAYFELELKGR